MKRIVITAAIVLFSATAFAAPPPGQCEVTDYSKQGIGGLWYKSTWGRYSADNVYKSGKKAVLRVDANTGVSGELNTIAADYSYGSYEIIMRTSGVPGTVAGWFYYFSDTSEIDMEILSNDPAKLHLVIHPNIGPATYKVVSLGFDASRGYHTYRFDWHPDRVEFYVDGGLVGTLSVNVPSTPGTILVNHWTNGDPGWSGGPPTSNAYLYVKKKTICAW